MGINQAVNQVQMVNQGEFNPVQGVTQMAFFDEDGAPVNFAEIVAMLMANVIPMQGALQDLITRVEALEA